MIRILVDDTGRDQAIRAVRTTWSHWSQIKPAFLDLQNHKCAFCEAELGGRPDPRTGARDLHPQHVEHFRPKGQVRAWPAPAHWPVLPPLETGPATGYPWLDLDPANYAASCTTCNSKYKGEYFPIRNPLPDYSHEPDVGELSAENPYLLFPFGFHEPRAPEDYIAFFGPDPIVHPALKEGSHEYWRARVTIALMGLDRHDLRNRRSRIVANLGLGWCTADPTDPMARGRALEARFCGPRCEFTSCARNYLALCSCDPEAAQRLAVESATEHLFHQTDLQILSTRWPNLIRKSGGDQ